MTTLPSPSPLTFSSAIFGDDETLGLDCSSAHEFKLAVDKF
jgi:hypothetical protein